MDSPLRFWFMVTKSDQAVYDIYNELFESYVRPLLGQPVEWRVLPWNAAWLELVRAYKRGSLPDVFMLGNTWIKTAAILGMLSEVPQGIDEEDAIALWLDHSIRHDGARVAVPWTVDPGALFARTDILEAIGASAKDITDWEGFYRVCNTIGDRLAANGHCDELHPYPYNFSFSPEPNTLHKIFPWLLSAGWSHELSIVQPARLLDCQPVSSVMSYMGRLWKTGEGRLDNSVIFPLSQDADFFTEGRYAFMMGSWWPVLFDTFFEKGKVMDFRMPFCPVPLPAGSHGSYTRGGGAVLAVSPQCKEKDKAWELVNILIKPEFTDIQARKAGSMPAHQGGFWERYSDMPYMDYIKQSIRNSVTYPQHPLWSSIESLLSRGFGSLLWHVTRAGGYDDKARQIARNYDMQIDKLIGYTWGLENV